MTNIQGSEFIHVKHGPSGHRVDLALAKLIERIPKSEGLALGDIINVYQVQSASAEFCTCKVYDENQSKTVGSNISVFRMRSMRRSYYHGQTIDGITFTDINTFSRTASDGSYTWTEYMVNPYAVGQLIVGVATLYNYDDGDIRIQEIDTYGRNWARDDTTIEEV